MVRVEVAVVVVGMMVDVEMQGVVDTQGWGHVEVGVNLVLVHM